MTDHDWHEIPVGGADRPAIIDAADVPLVLGVPGSWRLVSRYARTERRVNGKRFWIYMHRLILGAPDDLEVDHINHDKLDNRRGNLRLATRQQQSANVPRQRNNRSGYRGVSRARKRWQASIKVDGRSRALGNFDRPEDAARAYDAAARAAFGAFAYLNFPERAA